MSRWSEQDLSAFEKNSGRKAKAASKPAALTKKRSKYAAIPTTIDGIHFDSRLEARRYQELVLLMLAHKCWFIRQPLFDLGGGVTCRPDYLIVWIDDLLDGVKVTVEDCTGAMTKQKVRNYKQLTARYGIDVALVRSVAT